MDEINKILTSKKISIFGYPATGKTTFAIFLEELLGIKLYCIDQLRYEKASFEKRNVSDFEDDYYQIFKSDSWIIEGNALDYLDSRLKASDVLIYFYSNRYISVLKCITRYFRINILKKEKRLGTNWTNNYFHLKTIHWIIKRYYKKIKSLEEELIFNREKIVFVKSYVQLRKIIKKLKDESY